MARPSIRTLAAVVALVGLTTLAACGEGSNDPALDLGSTGAAPTLVAAVIVTVSVDGAPVRSGSVRCEDVDGKAQAVGTGSLLDAAAATAACGLLRANVDAERRLIDGPASDQGCTQVYGGSQVATVEGSLRGRQLAATIARTDGCGIADWDLLAALVGPAADSAAG